MADPRLAPLFALLSAGTTPIVSLRSISISPKLLIIRPAVSIHTSPNALENFMTSPKYSLLLVLSGCVTTVGACPATTPCQDEFIVESLFSGKGTGADGVRRYQHDAGVTLFVVITHNSTDKLEAQLHEPLGNGAIPRSATTAAGCALPDRIEWFNGSTGQRSATSATLSVLDGGTRAGESVTLRFENLRWFEDGSDAGHDIEPIEATLSVL